MTIETMLLIVAGVGGCLVPIVIILVALGHVLRRMDVEVNEDVL